MGTQNERLMYEIGENFVPMVALTDSGDHIYFKTASTRFSNRYDKANDADYRPKIRPDGVLSMAKPTPNTGTNDSVTVPDISCYLGGIWYSANGDQVAISGGNVTITRGSVNDYIINSITIDDTQSLVAVEGTEGTSFSATRGAAGGPPYIPDGSIELFQVKLNSTVAADITTNEIIVIPGTTQERADIAYDILFGKVNNGVEGYAGIEFKSELPLIHNTGDKTKSIYAEYYTPIMGEWPNVRNVTMPYHTETTNKETFYRAVVKMSESADISEGAFEAAINDGIRDAWKPFLNQDIWLEWYPDWSEDALQAGIGRVSISSNPYPADNVPVWGFKIAPKHVPFDIKG